MSRVRVASAACVVALLAGCGGGAGGGASGGSSAPPVASGNPAPGVASFTLKDVSVAPYAVWNDDVDHPITVTARTANTTGNIQLTLSYFDGLVGGSGAQITAPMYDDGTHGDAVAHDGVWTLTFALGIAPPTALRLYDGRVDAVSISITAASGDATVPPVNSIDANVDLAIVDRALENDYPVRAIDGHTQATDTLVNIVDPAFDETHLERTLQTLYRLIPGDPFDFAVLFRTRTTGDGVPRSVGVKNNVGGINVSAFDYTANYGSAGRLQQVVYQNAHVLGLETNHEIGHRWAAYLHAPALDLSLPTGFHWGPSNHVGQMGNGPYLQEEAGGYRITNADDSQNFVINAFSNLELYLMGLARPDEVQPLRFVTDPSVDVQFGALLPAASTRLVTIDDIIALYGERAPAMDASQNAFTAAFVVVSDRLLTQPEWTLSSHIAHYAGGASLGGKRSGGLFDALDPPSFSAATGHRASLETTLPVF